MTKAIWIELLLIASVAGFRTAHSQDEWTPQNSGTSSTLYRVQFIDSDIGYAVGDAGTVVRTTDGGTNWEPASVQTDYPVRDLSFIDGFTGWVGTGDPNNSLESGSVWKTTDGGVSWEQQPLGTTQARLGMSFVSADDGWACGANNGPWDIRATTDGGSSWHMQSGSGFGWVYDINCISPSTGWAIGVVYYPSSSGFVLKTSNGGSSWNQLNTGTVPFLYGVQFLDSDYGYAVGDVGTVLGTTNGGTEWSDLATGSSANLTDLSFISNSTGWVCGEGGTVLMTTDGGSGWDDMQTGTNLTLRGICFVDSVNGWAVGDGGIILKYTPETTGIYDNESSAPSEFAIIGNYPNPFNSSTLIDLQMGDATTVTVDIYNVLGRKVETLYSGFMNSGEHKLVWDGRTEPSGVYFYKLTAGDLSAVGRMTLLK